MRFSAAPTALIVFGLIPSPYPDFLWNLVALANFMRLSLLKGAREAPASAAWQEIRVPGWADVWSRPYGPRSNLKFDFEFSRKLKSPSSVA